MTSYTRHQLLLILLFVAVAGAGLAIDHWRRARPDVVERLEHLDRAEPAAVAPPEARRSPPSARERGARDHAGRERDGHARPVREHDRAGGERRARERDRASREPASRDDPARGPRPAAPTPDSPLDVNHASAPELARLPGIGRTLAMRIVEARPFDALDDLARVRGLRAATLARVRPLLTLAATAAAGRHPAFPLPP
jgi:Helix-hairpin-helix motif